MKLSYLIDTDWIIHYLNGNSGIVKKIGLLEKEGLAARQKGSVREFRNYSFIGVIQKKLTLSTNKALSKEQRA
jgi:hypothetical protein